MATSVALRQPVTPHQGDVHPRDRQNACAAERRGRDGTDGLGPPSPDHGMSGKKGRQMPCNTDRPHPGTAAAVRDTKRLVQIEMAHVSPDVARTAKADLGIHVGTVHVDLAAMRMHDLANATDARLKHAVSRRIRQHQRGQLCPDAPLPWPRDRPNQRFPADRTPRRPLSCRPWRRWQDSSRGQRRGSSRRCDALLPAPGDNARITIKPAYSPCEPAFGWSETAANPVISASQSSNWSKQLRYPRVWSAGANGCSAEIRPRHRQHLRGRVQLHRAGAERNHRVDERQVFRLRADGGNGASHVSE